MMLKNLMEDKQLNFDQPLLSVRRGPSTAILPDNARKETNNSIPSVPCLPYYKSELKSGPVRDPGAVPFQWEQIPGKPKDENKPQRMALEYPPLAPKLPPGRILNHIQKPSAKVLKDSGATKPQSEYDLPSSPDDSSLDKNVMELEKSGEEMVKENSSTGEDDSTYIDALDTLSGSESFFLNCSVTGVSGFISSDIKPSGTFSNQKMRGFIMDRFLIAAKAVASEMPQFGKELSVREQHRRVKNVVTWDMQSRYCYLPSCTPDKRDEAEEDEEDYDDTKNPSAKVCGLFPQFFHLNPIPGMRDQVQIPISSVCRVHKRFASAGSCRNSVNKDNRATIVAQRPTPVHKSEADDMTNNLHDKLNKITYLSDSRKSDESYMHGRVVGNGMAHYRNVLPTPFFCEKKGFIGMPEEAKFSRTRKLYSHEKGFENFHEYLANQKAEEDSDNANPTIEKTLYIDSVEIIESRSSNSSFSSELKGAADSRKRTPSVDYSLQDFKYLCCADEKALSRSRDLGNVGCYVASPLGKSSHKMQTDRIQEFQQNQDLKLDSNAIACLKLQDDQRSDVEVQQSTNTDSKVTTYDSSPPPLPKSPSESWLSRTLPSISSRNPSSKSHVSALSQGKLAARPSAVDPTWETIVKTSNLQHTCFGLPGKTTKLFTGLLVHASAVAGNV